MRTSRQKQAREEKEAFWRPYLSSWQASGLSAHQYCQAHALAYHQFKYWECELSAKGKKEGAMVLSTESDFFEVTSILAEPCVEDTVLDRMSDRTEESPSLHPVCCEVNTPNDFRVSIHGVYDLASLKMLFTALESLS